MFMSSDKSVDVIIVGGGVIGLSIAYHLSLKGISCFVFDRGEIGQEASLAAAGILGAMMETDAPGPLVELCLASQTRFPVLAETLLAETGIDIEYVTSGLVGVARTELEQQALVRKCEWAQNLGQSIEWHSTSELRALEPLLSEELLGGIYIPNDHQVNNAKLTQAFHRGAVLHGAQFFENNPVLRLITVGNRVTGVVAADGEYTADKVILATGSWSEQLASSLGLSLHVYPVKGQCFSAQLRKKVLHRSVFAEKCYLIPKRDGSILVGATQEEVGFNKETTVQGIQALYNIAVSMVPDMREAIFIRTWAGFRPGNPNIKPILGPVREWQNVILATGHFRKGILLSAITGEIVTSMVSGTESPIDWSPFALDSHINIEKEHPIVTSINDCTTNDY